MSDCKDKAGKGMSIGTDWSFNMGKYGISWIEETGLPLFSRDELFANDICPITSCYLK